MVVAFFGVVLITIEDVYRLFLFEDGLDNKYNPILLHLSGHNKQTISFFRGRLRNIKFLDVSRVVDFDCEASIAQTFLSSQNKVYVDLFLINVGDIDCNFFEVDLRAQDHEC